MNNVITLSIDVTLIDKTKLKPGRKKNKKDKMPQYLDLVLIPTKPTQYGDYRDQQTHMVCQSTTKEERDAGVRGEILGNASERIGDRDRRPPTSRSTEPAPAPDGDKGPPEDDDVPF